MTNLEKAKEECRAYNRMGGLDDQTIKDIAFDNRVPYETLLNWWNKQ